MSDTLLELRRKMKRKKPTFLRQDTHKHKRLKKKWVKPRGLHSKLRLQNRGHRSLVRSGYRSPREVRGLDRTGVKVQLVSSIKDIEKTINKGVIIVGSVGLRKKIDLVKKAKELGLQIINVPDPDLFLKKSLEDMESRKLKKVKLKEEKAKKLKKKEEKVKEKKSVKEEKPEELADKLKKEEEEKKKEKDKLLTKRTI